MYRIRMLCLCLILLVTGWSSLLSADQTSEVNTSSATVTVKPDQQHPISPYLFGHNIEYIGHGRGFFDVQEGKVYPNSLAPLSALRPAVLRFPGGTLSNFYHWQEGIGPAAKRGVGRRVDDAEHTPIYEMGFGTDEFMAFARQIGAKDLMFTVNVPTDGKLEPWMGTPQQAAAWVAYCNAQADNSTVIGVDERGVDWATAGHWAKLRAENGHVEPYNVRYWELGNEIFTHIKDPATYAKTCIAFSKAMKGVDPTIRIGVVGNDFHFHMKESPWDTAVVEQTHSVTDFLILHFYLPGINGMTPQAVKNGDTETTVWQRSTSEKDISRITLASVDRFRQKLRDTTEKLHRIAGKDYGLAITEFACDLRNPQDMAAERTAWIRSQQAAVFLADVLLAYQEYGLEVSNYWSLRSWEWSLLVEPSDDVKGKPIRQAPYYVFTMFANDWQNHACQTSVEAGSISLTKERSEEFKQNTHPALTAGASISRDGKRLAVLLVNRALEQSTKVTVQLEGTKFLPKNARMQLLAAPPYAVNTAESPEAVRLRKGKVVLNRLNQVKCILPPCSAAMLVIDGETQP